MGRKKREDEAGRATSEKQFFADAYTKFASEVDLRALAINPDEVFASVRDRTSGRT